MRVPVLLLLCSAGFAQPLKTPATLASLQQQAAEARDQNRLPDAIRLYRECVHLQPNWSEGWWYLGTLLYDQNAFLPAREALSRVVQLEPAAPPAAWALLGLCEFEIKAYGESLRHLEKSFVNESRDDPFARAKRYHTALLLTRKGDFELALKRLADIPPLGVESPELIRAYGVAGLRLPIFAAELPAAQQGLADAVGQALSERQESEAETKFQGLLATYPKQPEIHYLHGVSLLKSYPAQAVEELKRELAISPRHIPARLQLAFEYLTEGEPAKALPYAREALALDGNSFAAHAAVGQALVESGDLAKGIVELQRACALAPDSPQAHWRLAGALAKAGRKEEAASEQAIFTKLRNMMAPSTDNK